MSSEKNETREKILNACWQLTEGNLGKGARMSDIAKTAGVSRQALYLHFENRADLLIATTRFIDEKQNIKERLEPYRSADTGRDKLRELVTFWAHQMEIIQGMARALLALQATDPEANAAWQERMEALRDEIRTTFEQIETEGDLAPGWTVDSATNLLWSAMSFQGWEQLKQAPDFSTEAYIADMWWLAKRGFLT